jgi:hypothetical protein
MDAEEIGIKLSAGFIDGGLFDRSRERDTGVVDEHIQAAFPLQYEGHGCLDRGGFAHVHGYDQRRPWGILRRGKLNTTAGAIYAVAADGEVIDAGFAEARRATGNNYDLGMF